MGLPGRLRLLLPLLLLACAPAAQGLRCVQCESNQNCRAEECAPGQALCRTTELREWEDDEELTVVTRGCAHREKTNRTMSYRVGSTIVSLAETVCPGDLCNRPRPRGRGPAFPRGPYLECVSCTSLDQSCERGREQSLRCRDPGEQCIEVVTLQSRDRRANDQNYTRGCGRLPGCPGVSGFHGDRALHLLKCCNRTQCNGGPALGLQDLPPNGIRCYGCDGHECSSSDAALIDCRGPMTRCLEATGVDAQGNRSLTVRGCATASWCQGSHAADAFLLSRPRVSCCEGSACNRPSGGGAGPARLGLGACLLAVLLALAA